jgi:protein-S-isoprenylcysteine O-methyltransferase Ste14
MYLGMVVIYVGIALLIRSPWALVLLPLVVLGVDRLVIAKEERYLRGKFGETYGNYCSKVRRWI